MSCLGGARRDGTIEVDRAKDEIVHAALRREAAQLSAQPSHEARSDGQLVQAIRDYNDAFEARSRKRS
jgi:hypothetical protein